MDKSKISITVLGDGTDAVLILHGLLSEANALNHLYENAGKIADAVLSGMVDAEPVVNKIDIDTSNVVIPDGEFKGMRPIDVTDKYKDNGYLALVNLLNADFSNETILAINRELFRYVKWRFQAITNPEAFSCNLTEKQVKSFFKLFNHAVTDRMKANIATAVGYLTYDDAIEFGNVQIKQTIIKLIIEAYQ